MRILHDAERRGYASYRLRRSHIPAELRLRPQWVGWKRGPVGDQGKPRKIPINPHTGRAADTTNPTTWGWFPEALAACNRYRLDGVGYVFDEADPYFGLDADDCIDTGAGALAGWAENLVREFDTYTDVSVSDTGVKLVGRGKLAGPGVHRKPLELYDRQRFFALTGRLLPGAPREIREASREAANLYRLLTEARTAKHRLAEVYVSTLDDEALLARASGARNGAKFSQLWAGHWKGQYPSQSEADMALISMLAFWTGPDPDRIALLFVRSKLMRPKASRRDYLPRTIAAALAGRTVYYAGGLSILPGSEVRCGTHNTQVGGPGAGTLPAYMERLAEAAFHKFPLGNPANREEGDLFRLSLLCEGMAAAAKGEFFLSGSTVARLLKMSPRTAARRLERLVDAGELKVVTPGRWPFATEYAYEGPDLDALLVSHQ